MTALGSVARAGLVVSGAFLVSRVLGYVRLLVIGSEFGASAQLDAFFAAFRIPDLIFQLVAAGALSSALVPVMSTLFAAEEHARAWRIVSTVINLMLGGLAILSVGLYLLAPMVVPLITPGFDTAQLDKTIELTRIMLLSPIFLSMGAVATSVLNAGGRFAAAALAPIIYNVAIIGGAVILGPTLGVGGLAYGVVAGSLGHLLVQVRPLGRLGFRYTPRVDAADPQARQALLLMAPRAIGLGASQITLTVVTSLATQLGDGAVSDFNFSFALLQIPLGIIGVPLGIVLLPSLARGAAIGQEEAFAGLLMRAMRLLVYVMVPIAIFAVVARDPIVGVLFGSGRISSTDLGLIALTLAAFLVGLTAHALIAVLARAFYARQDTVTPVAAAIGAVVINTTLAVILVEPFGLPGIALAIAAAAWIEAVVLLAILDRRIPHLQIAGLLRVGIESLGGAVVVGLGAFALLRVIGDALGVDPGRLALLGELMLASVGFALVYVVISRVLRIPELPTIVGVMVDVIRRPVRS